LGIKHSVKKTALNSIAINVYQETCLNAQSIGFL